MTVDGLPASDDSVCISASGLLDGNLVSGMEL